MKSLLLLVTAIIPAFAQYTPIGTASDPCVGGTPYTTKAGVPVRYATNHIKNGVVVYDDFVCNVNAPSQAGGLVEVRLDFIEPCAGECSQPVTAPGQRMQNVYINDTQVLTGLDLFRYTGSGAGAIIDPGTVSRTFVVYPVNGKISVRVQTLVRSGVLAGIVVSGEVTISGDNQGFRMSMTLANPAPSGVPGGYDSVMYYDGLLKVLKADGTLLTCGQVQ